MHIHGLTGYFLEEFDRRATRFYCAVQHYRYWRAKRSRMTRAGLSTRRVLP